MTNKTFSQDQMRVFSGLIKEKILRAKDEEEFFDEPFEHLVIDNFLPLELATLALNDFPDLRVGKWDYQSDLDIEVKYRSEWESEFDVPDGILPVIRLLNSAPILEAIGARLGIPKLIPDPYFTGGGLNVTERGGLLDVHVDGNYHDASGLNRRVNAILYLNENWEESWGGHFGIYDGSGETCLKRVSPLFNRLVVFHTHDRSFHGLPEPLACPSDRNRKSIILYYYTHAKRPAALVAEDRPHSALWKRRGLVDKRGKKSRDYE